MSPSRACEQPRGTTFASACSVLFVRVCVLAAAYPAKAIAIMGANTIASTAVHATAMRALDVALHVCSKKYFMRSPSRNLLRLRCPSTVTGAMAVTRHEKAERLDPQHLVRGLSSSAASRRVL